MVKTNTKCNCKAYRAPGAPAKKSTKNRLEYMELKEIVECSSDYGLYHGCDLISQNIREGWEIASQIRKENIEKEDPNSRFFKTPFFEEFPADKFYKSKITDAPPRKKSYSKQPNMGDRMEVSCDGYRQIDFNDF